MVEFVYTEDFIQFFRYGNRRENLAKLSGCRNACAALDSLSKAALTRTFVSKTNRFLLLIKQ